MVLMSGASKSINVKGHFRHKNVTSTLLSKTKKSNESTMIGFQDNEISYVFLETSV